MIYYSYSDAECDGSVTSTQEVEVIYKAPVVVVVVEAEESVGGNFRQVRFDEDANEAFENHEITKEDTKAFWYNDEEYDCFKKTLRAAAKKCIQEEMEKTGRKDCYLNVMERIFDVCFKGENHYMSVRDWLEFERVMTISRIGMERLTVKTLRVDKKIRRHEVVSTVLEIQSNEFYSNHCERAREFMAVAVREVSEPSRVFAHRLAVVQHRIPFDSEL